MVEHAILEATEDLSIQLERLGRGNDTLGTASSLLSQPSSFCNWSNHLVMSRSNSQPTQRDPPILRLPPELVLMLSDFLPAHDSICLALTCRDMYGKVDDKHWRNIQPLMIDDKKCGKQYKVASADHDQTRWSVLTKLQPQLPGLELCHFCRIFHPRPSPDSGSLLRSASIESSGLECDAKEFTMGRWSSWGFAFGDLAAVMSHHFNDGSCGLPLSSLYYTTDWEYGHFYRRLYNACRKPGEGFLNYIKFDADAVIDGEHLLLHRTQRVWIPFHDQGTDVLIRYGFGEIANDVRICAHFGITSPKMILKFVSPLGDVLRITAAANHNHGDDTQPQDVIQKPLLHNCHECPTSFQSTLHVHDHGGGKRSVEIILDVWQNMGTCQNPDSPGWASCWGPLNPRFRGKDNRWVKGQSEVEHVNERQRGLFQVPAGASATSHSSAHRIATQWAALDDSAPIIPTWQPLTPSQLSTMLRSVETAMIH